MESLKLKNIIIKVKNKTKQNSPDRLNNIMEMSEEQFMELKMYKQKLFSLNSGGK